MSVNGLHSEGRTVIKIEAAQTLAREYLSTKRLPCGECVRILEFPDGTVTLHFSRTDTRFFRDGNLVEVRQSPGTLVVMVDRNDSSVWMPDQL
jgi:hypothetical protein